MSNSISDETDQELSEVSTPWVINLLDGNKPLVDMADRLEIRFNTLAGATKTLRGSTISSGNATNMYRRLRVWPSDTMIRRDQVFVDAENDIVE